MIVVGVSLDEAGRAGVAGAGWVAPVAGPTPPPAPGAARGRGGGGGGGGDEGGLALGAIFGGFTQDLGIKSKGCETLAQMLGAALHVGGVRRVGGHRRNGHQLGELIEQGRESGFEALPQDGCRQFM